MKIQFESIAEALIFCARQAVISDVTNKTLSADDVALMSRLLRDIENLAHEAPEKLEPRVLDGDALYFLNHAIDYRVLGVQVLRAAYRLGSSPL